MGLRFLENSNATSAFSVTRSRYPIFRSLRKVQDGRFELIWPENQQTRSQDLPKGWHYVGQFHWVNVEQYLALPKLMGVNSHPVKIPPCKVQDIDTEEDWELAEKLFRICQLP